VDRLEQMAFTKDEAGQLVACFGIDAVSVAELIRYVEFSGLMSRIKERLLCESSLLTQTTLKD
jgi:hypothetical protein